MEQFVFSNITWGFVGIQLIGFVGLLLNVVSYQNNTNKRIVGFLLVACFFWTVHFILLAQLPNNSAAYTAVALNVIGILRNFVFFMRPKAWAEHHAWLYVFLLCAVLCGIFVWNGPLTLLPTIAMLFSTVALYIINPKFTRRLAVGSSVCWLVFDGLTLSVPGVICETFSLVSIAIAMIRFDRKKTATV